MSSGASERAPHRVLVLGVTGLLGHVVFETLDPAVAELTGVMRRPIGEVDWWPPFRELRDDVHLVDGVDATDWSAVQRLLDRIRPDTIVNCIGLTPRRTQAGAVVAALRVNALLPHLLADWCAAAACRLITISTDCVFDHEPGGYTEADPTTATDLYGRTKALGEVVGDDVVTLRTSFIGLELVSRTELLEWLLGNAGDTVSGYRDVWYSGVPVAAVAAVVKLLVVDRRDLSGLLHLAAEEPISKDELLRMADAAFDAGITIEGDDSVTSHRTLDGSLLRGLLGLDAIRWDDALKALARDHRYDLRPDARLPA